MLVQQSKRCLGAELAPKARINFIGLRSRGLARLIAHAQAEVEAPSTEPVPFKMEVVDPSDNRAFVRPLQMEPLQRTLSSIPLLVFYPVLLAGVGASGLLGYVAGKGIPVDPDQRQPTAIGTSVLLAAGAATVAMQAKKARDSAAIVDLYNHIVDLGDPSSISELLISKVGKKYGINFHKEELEGLQKLYGEFLTSCIPLGDDQLMGDEPEKLHVFRTALGLTEEEAAPVHLEIGRRMYREGFETKNRTMQQLNRRAFQRLVYVSAIMFGDQRASVLLPWSQHFNLTNAQIFVARRDNAKAIFKKQLQIRGQGLPADRTFLGELREYQSTIKLMDESAEEVVREESRAHVEAILMKAMECIKRPGKARDTAGAVAEMKKAIQYSRAMANMAGEEGLIPGLGPVSIHGGALLDPFSGSGGKTRELHELYKTYMSESLDATGSFSGQLESDLKDLQSIMCISAKDAAGLRTETGAGLYKSLLKEAVISKRLDEAEAPADVLQELCLKVNFPPEAAMEMHRELYKNKLKSLLEGKKTLSDADEAELSRIRRILCLTNEVAQKAQMEITGKQIHDVIASVYDRGIQAVTEADLVRCEKAIKDLRMDTDVAIMVTKKVTIEKMRSFIKECQQCMEKGDRMGSAMMLKNLIQFNALVVTPVLERVKGTDAAAKELAELLMKAKEEAAKEGKEGAEAADAVAEVEKKAHEEDTIKSVAKALQASRGEFSDDEKKGQSEINLKDDLDQEKRAELYKQYLVLSMQGDVVELPMGGYQQRKNAASTREAEMQRLQQLAGILGMNQMEVGQTHQGLAKDAYKQQATDIIRSGPMNEEKNKYLEGMQAQLGLTKEMAAEVLKEVRTEVYGTSNFTEDGTSWTLERVIEERKDGKSLEGKLEEVSRRNLFRKELSKAVTDGTGELDPEYILTTLPELLELEKRKVDRVVKEMVGSRRRTLLVQAVSQVRQKRSTDALVSLNNLISCNKVLPETLPWNEKREIFDVFQAYCRKEADENKRVQLQGILGLTDDEANDLRIKSQVEDGDTTSEDEEVFF